MNKTDIEWCDFTWNPVTGCKRGCKYCYAKRIWSRFFKDEHGPFEDITYFPGRRLEPLQRKKPATIFVGSMSDHCYWPQWMLQKVVDTCKAAPQHTFMFLTKDPLAYERCLEWPDNTMQGYTVNTLHNHDKQLRFMDQFMMSKGPRKFINIEPLLGTVPMFRLKRGSVEKIIVGAETGPGAMDPHPKEVMSVLNAFPGQEIFWKDNIKAFVGGMS